MFLFFYFEKTICPRIVRQIIIACLAKSVKVFGHRVAQNQTAQHTVFIHVRLQNALELLENSNLTAAEIGEICGFATPEYFSRKFKQLTGEPPRRFRNH